jgi:hypothetical protein
MAPTTWRREIEEASAYDGDQIISCTLSEAELDIKFDPGFGGTDGTPFTAWSESYVYFPVCYDGSEWCERVPRNPGSDATSHVGG